MMSHDGSHDRHGKVVHRPCSSCISSVENLTGTLSSSLCQCQGRVERERSDPDWSGVTPEWKRVDNKGGGTTLASARALCLNLLSHVWLRISGGLNCCQESQRGVV